MTDLKKISAQLNHDLVRKRPEEAREIFDALPLSERAELIMTRRGRDRLDLILLSMESIALVQALPEPEFWITLKEIGEEDAGEIIRSATPEQLIHLSDLEWWHEGSIDPLPVTYWLMLLTEAGPEPSVRWFHHADEELLVSVFSRFFLVHKPDPDNEGAEPWRNASNLWTLDDAYFLEFFDDNAAVIIERFLSYIRAEEPMRYYGLLDLVELSVTIEMEDAAFGFRSARLADFGFVEFDDAMRIYEPLSDRELAASRREYRAGRPSSSAPRFPLALASTPPLLARALEILTDQAAFEEFTIGLAALVSRVLVADGMDISRIETLSAAAAKAQAFVEMGLERASGGDPEDAARALAELHPFLLFRAGYTRVTEAARRAEGLKRAGWLGRVKLPPAFLAEDGLLLDGLTRPRPLFYAGAIDDGSVPFREFRSRDEVLRAEQAVARVDALGLLFFGAMRASDEELARLSDFRVGGEVGWRTALATGAAQAFAGNDFRFAPLTTADARAALSAMLTDARPHALRPEIVDALAGRTATAIAGLAAAGPDSAHVAVGLVREALERVSEEAAELELSALDPRFFGSLLIRRED